MDILVSSNFERFMFYVLSGDSTVTNSNPKPEDSKNAASLLTTYIHQLNTNGGFTVETDVLERARKVFQSFRTSNEETLDCISRYYQENEGAIKYLLDPHTAVGVFAIEEMKKKDLLTGDYTVCLATASPGKFPEHVLKALNRNTVGKVYTFENIASGVLLGLSSLPKRCWSVVTGGDKSKGSIQIRAILECACKE